LDCIEQRLIPHLCDVVLQCPIRNDDVHVLRIQLQTQERCEAYYLERFRRSAHEWHVLSLLETEAIQFDPQAAGATFVEQCPQRLEVNDYCSKALSGNVALGGQCRMDAECTQGTYCKIGENYSCPGTCTARKGPGEACDWNEECEPAGNAHCDFSADPAVCAQRTIESSVALGQACGMPSPALLRTCEDGLWCAARYAEEGTCRLPIATGERCTHSDEVCDGFAICLDVEGSDVRTCSPLQLVTEVGAECSETDGDNPLLLCDVVMGLVCVEGRCELAGDGSVGSRCLPRDGGELSCQRGLYCNEDTDPPTCAKLLPAGAACDNTQVCETLCEAGFCAELPCNLRP
jgi:hypothetical protein